MNHAVPSRAQQALGFAGWLALCLVAGAIGGWASANANTFYAALTKPMWAPPGWLFGPVWTVLYVSMAIAAWLVWRSRADRKSRSLALWLFVAQLAVNALWSWLFFAWQLGGVAFAEIVLLWLLIACTIGAFWRVSRVASLLLAPYLLWVTFASALNWALWQANPGLLG
jgi:tryptophan-rich sensory protein